jgi:hypothetical protein
MYTSDTISYYNNILETTYKSLCDNNPNTILFLVGNEEFEDTRLSPSFSSQLINFIKQFSIVINALFVKLSVKIKMITKKYDSLFSKYYKELTNNKDNIDIEDFYNTKLSITPYITLYKRIKAIQQLFPILDNMDSIINASGNAIETPEMKKAFDYLTDIGFDAQNQSLISKVSNNYKNDTITQTVNQHMYTVDKIISLLNNLKSVEKYTKYSWAVNLKRKFDMVSTKLTNERRIIDNDNTRKNELQIKIKRVWWCSHFIKAAYTITNDVCKDLTKLSHAASQCIVRER